MQSNSFTATRGHNRQGGFVLVSVLWILAILTVVSLGFARRAMLERQMAWYSLDREQAQQMARGAAELAILELVNKERLDAYNNQAGYTGLNQRWAIPVDLLRDGQYFREPAQGGFENDICVYTIEDCERRISLNLAPQEVLEEFDVLQFGTIEDIMRRRTSGERGYQAHWIPDVDELQTMQFFSPEEWNGYQDEAGIRQALTVWGDGLINVNTAPFEVLRAIPDVDEGLIEAILDYRSGPDGELYTGDDGVFESLQIIARRLEISAEKMTPIHTYCKTNSQFFKIRTQATRRQGKINAFCTVVVEVYGSATTILEWKEEAIGA